MLLSSAARCARTSLGLASFGALVACSGPSLEVLRAGPAASNYLSAERDQLVFRGAPYRFLGFNAFTLTGCGNADELFDATALDDFFASLRPHSLVRTYAFHSLRAQDIDAVVQSATRHEQLLSLVLSDANGSCSDDGSRKDQAWYASGFRDTYLPWVRELTSRYREQSSVGMWELVGSPVEVDVATLRAFYDEVGGVVHQLAPRHLVSSGTHGTWAYGGSDGYALIHESAGIDVAGFRDYDQNRGAPPNLESSLLALGGSKPLVLAEAGVYASREGDPSDVLNGRVCVSWAERREVLATWIDASFATPLAGISVWNYLPIARAGCEYSSNAKDPLFALIHDAPLP